MVDEGIHRSAGYQGECNPRGTRTPRGKGTPEMAIWGPMSHPGGYGTTKGQLNFPGILVPVAAPSRPSTPNVKC